MHISLVYGVKHMHAVICGLWDRTYLAHSSTCYSIKTYDSDSNILHHIVGNEGLKFQRTGTVISGRGIGWHTMIMVISISNLIFVLISLILCAELCLLLCFFFFFFNIFLAEVFVLLLILFVLMKIFSFVKYLTNPYVLL